MTCNCRMTKACTSFGRSPPSVDASASASICRGLASFRLQTSTARACARSAPCRCRSFPALAAATRATMFGLPPRGFRRSALSTASLSTVPRMRRASGSGIWLSAMSLSGDVIWCPVMPRRPHGHVHQTVGLVVADDLLPWSRRSESCGRARMAMLARCRIVAGCWAASAWPPDCCASSPPRRSSTSAPDRASPEASCGLPRRDH